MKENGMEKIIETIKEYNTNKEVINEVANQFLSQGFNKSMAKRVFVDSNRIYELNQQLELICFTKALHQVTRRKDIDVEKIFTQEELNKYQELIHNSRQLYYPKQCEELDEYDLAKLDFLNEKYGNRNTKQHYYYLYLAHIKDEEKYLGHDLCEFSIYEIMDTMQGVVGSIATRNNTLSFITKYLDYCVDKGIIDHNVLHSEIANRLTQDMVDKGKEGMANTYVTFEELDDELKWIESDVENNVHVMDIMIVFLLRSGISSKEIVGLKNSDFNFDTNIVTIKNEKGLKKIKLNNITMKWVDICKQDNGVIPNTRFVLKSLDDHIIKLVGDTYNEEQALASIRRRLAKFKQVGFRALNENILLTCKKIDLLDGIAKKNGIITTNDFKKVQVYFGNSEGSYFKLKTEYELVRGVENIDQSSMRKSR